MGKLDLMASQETAVRQEILDGLVQLAQVLRVRLDLLETLELRVRLGLLETWDLRVRWVLPEKWGLWAMMGLLETWEPWAPLAWMRPQYRPQRPQGLPQHLQPLQVCLRERLRWLQAMQPCLREPPLGRLD